METLDKRIIKMYNEDNKSTYEIAESLGTYPNKIRRTLNKHGIPLKNKSQAQKNALETGRSPHPTEGKKRSLNEKVRISDGLMKYWEEMSKEDKKKRVEQAKK